MADPDEGARLAAFEFLTRAVDPAKRTITWAEMLQGFEYRGGRVSLASLQGIFKPREMKLPLSIRTGPPKEGGARRYEDSLSSDGFLLYKYRDTGDTHSENEGLRVCMRERIPLIYFFGLVPGLYEARWPVRVLDDDRRLREFQLTIDEGRMLSGESLDPTAGLMSARSYATRTIFERMHQRGFRVRVLRAYRSRCAVCTLRREELLEAAHIIPDSEPEGLPVVQNGISMCTLHHAAFDQNVLGIRPDRIIKIRKDVRDEEDGPMLVHGLQGFHNKRLADTTRSHWRPRPDFLERRYAEFQKAV